ncbi:DAK2 domain-containing protein [Nocardia aurantia]|uniref:DAK2 domain-containing protein n=1 Tax=Nocardia aurantia TaxID=2585199 RepID=UPI003872D637
MAVSVGEVAGAMARAATVGARGNSGIILSQVLRGFADAAAGDSFSADELRNALRRAGILVRTALSDPIEGTMLTVLDAAADRAAECAADATLGEVATAAAGGAAKALGETPSQLDVLRTAGVVDAGARGLLVLLDALVAVTTGQQVERPRYPAGFRAPGGRFGAASSSRERSDAELAAAGVADPTRIGNSAVTDTGAALTDSTGATLADSTGAALMDLTGATLTGPTGAALADSTGTALANPTGAALPGSTGAALVDSIRPGAVGTSASGDRDRRQSGAAERCAIDASDRTEAAAPSEPATGADGDVAHGPVISADGLGEGEVGRSPGIGANVRGAGGSAAGADDRGPSPASGRSAISPDGRGAGNALRELGITEAGRAGSEQVVGGDGRERARVAASQTEGGLGAAVPRYEVMYVLSGTDEERIAGLRRDLARLGDSVVVVGDGSGTWSAHVHTADAGAAVEAGLAAGTLRDIRIEGLESGPVAVDSADRGILTVAFGPGAAQLFEDAGAVVLDGGVTADSLLTAILAMPYREVLVLANGALPAHELVTVSVAARGTDPAQPRREVLMLPSGAMVQGLAALSVHDAQRTAVDDVFAMSEAAAGTRWGAVRVAAERALTIVGTCARGDGLGLVGHDVVVIDPDVRAAARTLLDRMLGLGGELVTLLVGADSPAGLGDELSGHITATYPGVEVVVYDGGQPMDLIQIGVE